jgi:hypothetical protein
MNTALSIPTPRRELARRLSGGLEVTLYWSAHDDSTSIEVRQPDEEPLTFAIARERALDAFYHPFAYLHEASNDLPLTLNRTHS